MISGLDLYKMFNAFSLHFNEKTTYDYFKYHGSVKVTEEKFNTSKFKWQFIGIAKLINENKLTPVTVLYRLFKTHDFKYVPTTMRTFKLMSTMCYNDNSELCSVQSDMQYLCNKYNDDLSRIAETDVHLYPNIYKEYMDEQIGLETLILYDSYISRFLVPEGSKDIISWPSKLKQFEKVRGFVELIVPRTAYNDFVMSQLV